MRYRANNAKGQKKGRMLKPVKVFNNAPPNIRFIHLVFNSFNRVFNIFEFYKPSFQLSKKILVTVF